MIIIKNVAKIQQSLIGKIHIIFLAFLLSISIAACSTKKENETDILEKKPINPNAQEKAREFANKNPLFNKDPNKNGGTFQFASSNVLWRASLKTLDFIPLNNTDYSGGVIVTDWYGSGEEQIKISVRFLSNELISTAIKVIAHKRVCTKNNCKTTPADEMFNEKIKNKILNEARTIKIKEEKNK